MKKKKTKISLHSQNNKPQNINFQTSKTHYHQNPNQLYQTQNKFPQSNTNEQQHKHLLLKPRIIIQKKNNMNTFFS
jgi:hypothetical protein